MTPDELRSPEASGRVRVVIAAIVVLAVAIAAIVLLRPDRKDAGTPAAGASTSVSPSASPAESPSPSPSPSTAASPSPLPVPPPLRATTASRLAVVQGTRIDILDVDAGSRTTLPKQAWDEEYDRFDVVAVGHQLVMVGDNNTGAGSGPFPVYATTPERASKPRALGHEASYLLRSVRAGRVWLVADKDSNDADWGTTLTEVDLRGVVHQRKQFAHTFGVKPFAGGFLRDVGDATNDPQDIELVNSAGTRRQLFRHVSLVFAEGDTALLAERGACEQGCDLHVLTAGPTVRHRVVHLRTTPDLVWAGLTNDRSRLFLEKRNLGHPSTLAEMSLQTGETHQVSGAAPGAFYGPSFRFSADGRWMFFIDGDERHINACDLRTERIYRVQGAFDRITQLELLP